MKFWMLIAAALVLIVVNQWEPLDLLLGSAVAIFAGSAIWSRSSLSGIALQRTISKDQAQVGETLIETLTVTNQGRLPRLWVEVRDHSSLPTHRASRVVHLRGKSTLRWETESTCVKRGRYHLGPLTLRSGDPFGLFPRLQVWPQTIDVTVFPPEATIARFTIPAGTLTGAATTEHRTPFVTPSVATIRDYVNGDPLNRISWSASARMSKLMVKEFDFDPTSDIWIVLDLEARFRVHAQQRETAARAQETSPLWWMDTTDDYAASAAASISRHCLEHGRAVGLIASGAHHEVLQAERSTRTHLRILQTLAVVQADGVMPLAEILVAEWRRFSRHAGVVIITSSTDDAWMDAVRHLQARRVHIVVVYVDPATFSEQSTRPIKPIRIAGEGIPAYLVQYGVPIETSLSSPA